jgi:hypothetical protein
VQFHLDSQHRHKKLASREGEDLYAPFERAFSSLKRGDDTTQRLLRWRKGRVLVPCLDRTCGWKFILQDAQTSIKGIRARIVFCLDLLFHILDDSAYVRILENLCMYSKEWIFIFTWSKNPFDLSWRAKTLLFDFAAGMLKKHPSRFSGLEDRIMFLRKQPDSDGLYRKFRDFTKYTWILRSKGFALVALHTMPTKVDYYHNRNTLYVFKKL